MSPTNLEIASLKGLCENIVWTHKVHEKQADIELSRSKRCRYLANLLLAVSASGILGTTVVDEWWLKTLLAILSFGSLAISIHRDASCFELNFAEHSSYARSFLRLRERAVNLLLQIGSHPKKEYWQAEFESIQKDYLNLCDHAPRTSKKALKKAGRAICEDEESSLLDLLNVLVKDTEPGGGIG